MTAHVWLQMSICNIEKMWCTSIEQHIFVPLSWPRLSTLPKTDWSKEWFPPKPQSTLPTYTGALGTDTRGHREKSIVKSVSLTFNFSKITKTIHTNRKETLIRFHKPLRQDFQMQAISNRCYPTAKNQLFLFCNCTCLKWLYSIQWGGQELRMGNPGQQKLLHGFTMTCPFMLWQSPPQIGRFLSHSAFKQGNFIQVPHGDISDDLCQVLVKQRENDDV